MVGFNDIKLLKSATCSHTMIGFSSTSYSNSTCCILAWSKRYSTDVAAMTMAMFCLLNRTTFIIGTRYRTKNLLKNVNGSITIQLIIYPFVKETQFNLPNYKTTIDFKITISPCCCSTAVLSLLELELYY